MTDFKKIIINWILNGAEKNEVIEIFNACNNSLNIDNETLIKTAKAIRDDGSGLEAIKFIKDKVGLSLQEAKTFYDLNVRNII